MSALEHTLSCPMLTPNSDDDCTCGLSERIKTQTAETLLAAWQKRAYEAESTIEELEKQVLIMGERAVVDFDDPQVGACDALVKDGYKYKDWIKMVGEALRMHGSMKACLLAYQEWEADLVLNGDWTFSDGLPKMTQAQYDRFLEIQNMRNEALKS